MISQLEKLPWCRPKRVSQSTIVEGPRKTKKKDLTRGRTFVISKSWTNQWEREQLDAGAWEELQKEAKKRLAVIKEQGNEGEHDRKIGEVIKDMGELKNEMAELKIEMRDIKRILTKDSNKNWCEQKENQGKAGMLFRSTL